MSRVMSNRNLPLQQAPCPGTFDNWILSIRTFAGCGAVCGDYKYFLHLPLKADILQT
jgi:hypothetical protein